MNHIITRDVQIVLRYYFFHDLFELRVFHDETHQMVKQVGQQIPLRVLKL